MKPMSTAVLVFCYCLLPAFSNVLSGQDYKYFKISQKPTSYENACLWLRKQDRHFTKRVSPDLLNNYKAVKISGFNEAGFNTDSVLQFVASVMSPTAIIFENTDVSAIEGDFDKLNKLKEITILGDCDFFESSFYPALKKIPVEIIRIQRSFAEFSPDSMHLLGKLRSVYISNSVWFGSINKSVGYSVVSEGNLNSVLIHFCGSLEKQTEGEPLTFMPSNTQKAFRTPYTFIRQPIPGIDINDTIYTVNAATRNRIQYESGSVIDIDKNAFMYEDGSPFKGRAEIFYREFRNPVDIMLSGIPMTVQDGDSLRVFKSGGMYEMYARDMKGKELKTVTDTSIKITFAMTDTSRNFNFYALNSDGGWAVKNNQSNLGTSDRKVASRAVAEYFSYFYKNLGKRTADTTHFESRFGNSNYIHAYRKDNLRKSSHKYLYPSGSIYGLVKTKGLVRIKVLRKDKDKGILFTMVPAKKHLTGGRFPDHIRPMLGRTYLYTGGLNLKEFKEKYCTQQYYWDIKVEEASEVLSFSLKTGNGFEFLMAQCVNVLEDKSIYIPKKANRLLARRSNMLYKREARVFNRKDRGHSSNYNDVTFTRRTNASALKREAFEKCKRLQTSTEAAMNFNQWDAYAMSQNFRGGYGTANENVVSSALVMSGLGVYNIDEYIHSGQMEPVLVYYKGIDKDSVAGHYNAVLYESINTSFPMYMGNSALKGYYFKKQPNYLVRFGNGHMQVIKPAEIAEIKQGSSIRPDYKEQHVVAGLSSADIAKLIFD